MDDPITNKFFAQSLDLHFPLLSTLFLVGIEIRAYSHSPPSSRTVLPCGLAAGPSLSQGGIVRYIKMLPDIKRSSLSSRSGKRVRGRNKRGSMRTRVKSARTFGALAAMVAVIGLLVAVPDKAGKAPTWFPRTKDGRLPRQV